VDLVEGLPAVGDGPYPPALPGEQPGEVRPHVAVVVGDQDPGPGQLVHRRADRTVGLRHTAVRFGEPTHRLLDSGAGGVAPPVHRRAGQRRSARRRPGERHGEGAADAHPADHPDLAALQPGQLVHQGQADAGALVAA
jgi:hypothetical protein